MVMIPYTTLTPNVVTPNARYESIYSNNRHRHHHHRTSKTIMEDPLLDATSVSCNDDSCDDNKLYPTKDGVPEASSSLSSSCSGESVSDEDESAAPVPHETHHHHHHHHYYYIYVPSNSHPTTTDCGRSCPVAPFTRSTDAACGSSGTPCHPIMEGTTVPQQHPQQHECDYLELCNECHWNNQLREHRHCRPGPQQPDPKAGSFLRPCCAGGWSGRGDVPTSSSLSSPSLPFQPPPQELCDISTASSSSPPTTKPPIDQPTVLSSFPVSVVAPTTPPMSTLLGIRKGNNYQETPSTTRTSSPSTTGSRSSRTPCTTLPLPSSSVDDDPKVDLNLPLLLGKEDKDTYDGPTARSESTVESSTWVPLFLQDVPSKTVQAGNSHHPLAVRWDDQDEGTNQGNDWKDATDNQDAWLSPLNSTWVSTLTTDDLCLSSVSSSSSSFTASDTAKSNTTAAWEQKQKVDQICHQTEWMQQSLQQMLLLSAAATQEDCQSQNHAKEGPEERSDSMVASEFSLDHSTTCHANTIVPVVAPCSLPDEAETEVVRQEHDSAQVKEVVEIENNVDSHSDHTFVRQSNPHCPVDKCDRAEVHLKEATVVVEEETASRRHVRQGSASSVTWSSISESLSFCGSGLSVTGSAAGCCKTKLDESLLQEDDHCHKMELEQALLELDLTDFLSQEYDYTDDKKVWEELRDLLLKHGYPQNEIMEPNDSCLSMYSCAESASEDSTECFSAVQEQALQVDKACQKTREMQEALDHLLLMSQQQQQHSEEPCKRDKGSQCSVVFLESQRLTWFQNCQISTKLWIKQMSCWTPIYVGFCNLLPYEWWYLWQRFHVLATNTSRGRRSLDRKSRTLERLVPPSLARFRKRQARRKRIVIATVILILSLLWILLLPGTKSSFTTWFHTGAGKDNRIVVGQHHGISSLHVPRYSLDNYHQSPTAAAGDFESWELDSLRMESCV